MKQTLSFIFAIVLLVTAACKKDTPTLPPTVETDPALMQCYNEIDFNTHSKSSGKAWFKTHFGDINWSVAEGKEGYEFRSSEGEKDFLYQSPTATVTVDWKTLSFSLWPSPSSVSNKTPHAAERIRMFVTAPSYYSVEDIVNEYIKVGKLKLHDMENLLEPGGFGFVFDCICDSGGGIWYESYLGTQTGHSIECTKKNKRVENGKTYYDLAFKFSANIYSYGLERWTTFEKGEFDFTIEME